MVQTIAAKGIGIISSLYCNQQFESETMQGNHQMVISPRSELLIH